MLGRLTPLLVLHVIFLWPSTCTCVDW